MPRKMAWLARLSTVQNDCCRGCVPPVNLTLLSLFRASAPRPGFCAREWSRSGTKIDNMKINVPSFAACGLIALVGIGALVRPIASSAAEADDLTQALRAKIEELRHGPPMPAKREGATLPSEVEATLREALRQQMADLADSASEPTERPGVVPRRPPAEKAGMNMAPQPNPDIVPLPPGTIVSVPADPSAAPAPPAAPASPLEALDEQYRAGQISPRAYHEQRARLIQRR